VDDLSDILGDEYEAVIGLEVHCQLDTASKLFSGASTTYGAEPNSQVAPLDMGLPGTLPVVNRKAVEYAVRAGLALRCDVRNQTKFARKNYFYPDLPKGYQISQHRAPLCENGELVVPIDGDPLGDGDVRRVGIQRLHLEEDAGKSTHLKGEPHSLVDLNRCGVPLIEIVSEPDLRTPAEARAYMKALRDIVVFLDISDGEMSEGSLRCDANVSVRRSGDEAFGTRTELKNINSFKFVHDGIAAEIRRQIELLEAGEPVEQETRLYDVDAGRTRPMRSKEESHDYRYFPEPDLPVFTIDEEWIEEIRANLPALPAERRRMYREAWDIGQDDAGVLTGHPALANFFEAAVTLYEGDAQDVANWIVNQWLRVLNDTGHAIDESGVEPDGFVRVLELVGDETISQNAGQTVLEEMITTGRDAETIVDDEGLRQMTDAGAIESLVDDVLDDNPEQFAEYRDGNNNVLGWFIGQVMQASGGSADPKIVRSLLQEKLDS
jgi:aspartyl-tRNA(Asn)/glutamyl-tRNA(Gln) amidotransferase subunit B